MLVKKLFNKLYNLSLRALLKIVPKINRNELIKMGKRKNSIYVVENPYDFLIKEPKQKLAKKRFKSIIGLKKIDCFFGVILDDIRLIGPYGLAFTRSGKIVLETSTIESLKSALILTIQKIGLIGFLKQYFFAIFPSFDFKGKSLEFGAHLICRTTRMVIKNDVLHTNPPTFGHWMLERLPQLRAFEAIINKKENNNCKLILNKTPANWQIESLELMGYNKKKIFRLDYDGLRVERLIISSLRSSGTKTYEFDPKARRWVAERLKSNYNVEKISKKSSKANICLFRQDIPSRRIKNINSLRKILKQKKFKELHNITDQNLFESSKDFINAKRFLYTYGSGVTRILFSKNLKEIIEIFSCDQDKKSSTFLFAAEMGIEYKCLPAGKLPISILDNDERSPFFLEEDKNEWYVPLEELKTLIN